MKFIPAEPAITFWVARNEDGSVYLWPHGMDGLTYHWYLLAFLLPTYEDERYEAQRLMVTVPLSISAQEMANEGLTITGVSSAAYAELAREVEKMRRDGVLRCMDGVAGYHGPLSIKDLKLVAYERYIEDLTAATGPKN